MNRLAKTLHHRNNVLTPQVRVPWAWLVPEMLPAVVVDVPW
jgi:hypothetical protein